METNEKVRLQREQLGLSQSEIARSSGIGLDDYYDIELYPGELISVVSLRLVKKLCECLQLSVFELLNLDCAFCKEKEKFESEYSLPRNELIKSRRIALGLSAEALGDLVNYYATEMEKIEADGQYIESWRVTDITALSVALRIPLQILMRLHCTRCGE